MSTDPKRPDVGDLVVDATNLAPVVVDLPPGGLQGLRAAQPGCHEAIAELTSNQPKFGVTASVRDEDVAAIVASIARIDEIDALLPPSEKLVELLKETRAVLDDGVQRRISMIAEVIERRAKMLRNDELLASYAKTCEYRSSIAFKAARTRRRNQAAVEIDEPVDPIESVETSGPIEMVE